MSTAENTQEPQEKEQLPRWDLSEYYASFNDPQIKADIAEAQQKAEAFAARYKGKVAGLSGDELALALEEDDAIDRIGGKPSYYGSLLKSLDGNNEELARFVQSTSEAYSKRASTTMFFGLELRAMGEDALRQKMAESPRLQQYSRVIEDVIKEIQYSLPDEAEMILQKMAPAGPGQFVRFYQEDKVRRRYHVNGKELDEVETRLLQRDKDIETRKAAIREFSRVTAENIHLPVFVMNNIIKAKEIQDTERGYATPMQARNMSNDLEDEVVDTLIETVKENYEATSQRFNLLFAQMLGKDKLDWWDSEKDLPGYVATKYSFEEAKNIVLDAYRAFSPEMADIAQKFFDEGWIDAEPRKGKRGGAYAMPALAGGHPHVFLNFQGEANDVMTMAHELGHGIHQYLEERHQHSIVQGTPLTIAETASVFGEELVFQALLSRAGSLEEKKILLFEKTQDDLGTCASQIMYADFEKRIHEARKDGELTAKDFGTHWNAARDAMRGDTIKKDPEREEESQHTWSAIPHLFRTPFYVYAYSFGQLLVNSLYNAYEEGKVEDFQQKYFEALSAGGTKHHSELLKPFGLDASKKEFWQGGLDVIIRRIDQLEQVIAEEKAQQAGAQDEEPVRVASAQVVGADKAQAAERARG